MLTKADIDWLKSEFLPDLAEAVERRLKNKLDDIGTKLDKFVGDIKSKREEQILHQAQHGRVDGRLTRVEEKLSLPPVAD